MQITVRLPDEIMAWIDAHVSAGDAPSRAVMLARVVDRERRRERAEQDVLTYLATCDDTEERDLSGLAAWAAQQPITDLD